MLYRLYRAVRQIPFADAAVNGLLRRQRNLFWSLRPASVGHSVSSDYLAFVESRIDGSSFTLIEVGAGDGRILGELAKRYPQSRLIGVDIQKAAIAEGKRRLAEEGLTNVKLVCSSCLNEEIDWECDYLISRTALIYLNRQEIELFLRKRLPKLGRAMLLHEIISLTGKAEVSHFFANPLGELVKDAGNGEFTVSTRLLDYPPWKNKDLWSGAELTIRRR